MIFRFHKKLPQRADIFKPKSKGSHPHLKRFGVFALRATGLLAAGLLIFIGGDALLTTGKTSLKQVATPFISSTPNANGNSSTNYFATNGYGNSGFKDVTPYYAPTIPIMRYANENPNNNSYNYAYQYQNNQNNQNVNGISGQITNLQQRVGATMQNCVSVAHQGANQILAMKQQALQMQKRIDAINNQSGQIDTSTPGGQQQQQNLNNQAQQLQNQLDSLNNAIGTYQDRYNQNNDTCRQNVDQLIQAREDAEGKLNDAFNQAMDISTDLPNQ